MPQDTVVQVSYKAKLYVAGGSSTFPTLVTSIIGVGGAGAPSFTEYGGLGDATINAVTTESDVSIRAAGGVKLTEGSLKDISIDFTVPHVRGDPKREAFFNSFWNQTVMGIACLDGPKTEALSKGFVCDMKVQGAPREENIDGVLKTSFTLKPCYPGSDSSGNLSSASLVTASTSGTLTLVSSF